jgi:hypothetical protein
VTYVTYLRKTGKILAVSATPTLASTEEVGVVQLQEQFRLQDLRGYRISEGKLVFVEKSVELEERSRKREEARLERLSESRKDQFYAFLGESEESPLREALRLVGEQLFGFSAKKEEEER